MAESENLPGYEASLWYGFMAPARTPPGIVRLLNEQIVKAAQAPDVRKPLAGYAVDMIGSSPEGFADHLRREMDKWAKVIGEANIRAE